MLREIKRVFAIIFVSALLVVVPARALSSSPLERISEHSEYIEINEPAEGYDFDANFLAKNQELSYKTTIKNDEEYPIRISSIALNNSSYDFLEYSYDGIEVGDELEIGDEQEIIISVKTNNNNTRTVSEDYELSIDYDLIKIEGNPETSTTAVISTISAAVVGAGAIVFIFARSKKIRHFAIIFTISSLGVYCLSANAVAEEATSFTIRGLVSYTNTYKVTVNPNGGIYDGKTENAVVYRREGQSYHVDEATRDHFEFVEWEVNPGELDANNDIEIHHDTTIKAKWNENSYTLTIKPNGGEYLGSTEEWSESFRPNETATISTPELEGYNFTNWTVEEGNVGTDGIFTGASISMVENVTLVANYEIKKFTVTVIPNGGIYHGSANTFTQTVDWNTDYEIEPISYEGYDLKEWTKTVGETSTTLAADTQSVNIKADTVLEANWWSSSFYTVTIIPNGGVYDGKAEPSEYSVRAGTEYEMLEATYEGMLFHYWHYTDTDTHMDEDSFTVTGDVSLTAEWQPIVARIERTQKLYPSIMAAHEEANPGDVVDDIITLLVDTTEIVTNSKRVTLDLNEHTVTGYLVNAEQGDLTLINGEFNNYINGFKDDTNPLGAAVINNGALQLGYNDYENEDSHNKAPLIDNNYIRLKGQDRGMIQNGTLNYYDGFMEGEIGLVGGYNDSPWYRDTDSPEHDEHDNVHYFPLVSNIQRDGLRIQHVQLNSANRAVSRTINNGAIYYYDLQDNINSSAVTGYDIYAVRNFEAGNPITVSQGDSIKFDLDGFTVTTGESIVNNGTFEITDSANPDSGREKGILRTNATTINNGTLKINDAMIEGISSDVVMRNNNTLQMTKATIQSAVSIPYQANNANEVLTMDNDSYIKSLNASYPALKNNTTLTLTSGNVEGPGCAVENRGSFTLDGGTVRSSNVGICNYNYTHMKSGNVTVNGSRPVGIGKEEDRSNIEITGGTITAAGSDKATGVDFGGSANGSITGGTITATAPNGASGIYAGYSTPLVVNGKDVLISASCLSWGDAYAVEDSGEITLSAGTFTANSNTGYAAAVYLRGTVNINGDDVLLQADSTNDSAYGVYAGSGYYSGGTVNMSAGAIRATAHKNGEVGTGIDTTTVIVTGGNVYGSSYGIDRPENWSANVRLGSNVAPLFNGQEDPDDHIVYAANPVIEGGIRGINDINSSMEFYDGIIKGGSGGYIKDPNAITAVAGGTYRYVNDREDGQDCWLLYDAYYLEVDNEPDNPDNETFKFRDLAGAFNKVENGGKITVIDDKTTTSVHSTNTKNITFDLNNHTLNFTQPIGNSGTILVTDGSQAKGGKIVNSNSTIISNDGTMTIDSGLLDGQGECVVTVGNSGRLNVNGGIIKGSQTTVCNYNYVLIDGGTISGEGSSPVAIQKKTDYTSVELKSGNITATGSYRATGVSISDGTFTMTGGNLTVTAPDDTYGVTGGYSTKTINGANAKINVTSTGDGEAIGIAGSSSRKTIVNAGTITVRSNTDVAMGIKSLGIGAEVKGDNILIDVVSTNSDAYGVNGSSFEMTGGRITATASNASRTGIGIDITEGDITGGEIYGSTYGSRSSRFVTMGRNEAPLYNGQEDPDTHIVYEATPKIEGGMYGFGGASTINFYDGIIVGGREYAQDKTKLISIPDGTYPYVNPHTEDEGEDCWLMYDKLYLEVDNDPSDPDNETFQFRDFESALNKVENGGKITVIDDVATAAVLPTITKNITFDLNNHSLTYSQTLNNAGTLTITDGSLTKGGKLINNTGTAVNNTGTLTIDSGAIESTTECAVTVSSGTLYANGGTIKGSQVAVCNGNAVVVNGGSIVAEGASPIAIQKTQQYTSVTFQSGNITATGTSKATGMSISEGSLNMTGGTLTVTAPGDTIGVSGTYSQKDINGVNAKINVTSTGDGDAVGVSGMYTKKAHLTAGAIAVTSNSGKAIGIECASYDAVLDGDNASIVASSNSGEAYGIYTSSTGAFASGSIEMSAGNIRAISQSGLGVGINTTSMEVTGGTVYGSSYGVNRDGSSATLTLGVNEAPVYNGLDGNAVNPIIEGGTYGVADVPSAINFYDGVVKGGTSAFKEIRDIKRIADNTNIHDEVIDGVDNKYLASERYVAKIGTGVCAPAEVGTTCYTSIQAAANASNSDDIITLVEDNYIFYSFDIPADKKVTLDLAGFNIYTGIALANSGDLKIINTGTDVTLEYLESEIFITNKANAKLEIDGVSIKAKYPIKSETGSNLTLKNLQLNDSVVTAVESYGDLSLNSVTISASNHGVSQSNGQLTIVDSAIHGNVISLSVSNSVGTISGTTTLSVTRHNDDMHYAYSQVGASADVVADGVTMNGGIAVNGGEFELKNSAVAFGTTDTDHKIISNAATMTINKSSITADGGSSNVYVIKNTGTMTINNATTITDNESNSTSGHQTIGNSGNLIIDNITINRTGTSTSGNTSLFENTGTATITNTTVTASTANRFYGIHNSGTGSVSFTNSSITMSNANTSYGVYAETEGSNVVIYSGTIKSNGNDAYGLWMRDKGAVTLGIAEDSNSSCYAQDCADVKTDNPVIEALGTTSGYAAVVDGGRFYYYDGRLIQNQEGHAIYSGDLTGAGSTAGVEYWYEPQHFVDENNHDYYILTYMPKP